MGALKFAENYFNKQFFVLTNVWALMFDTCQAEEERPNAHVLMVWRIKKILVALFARVVWAYRLID